MARQAQYAALARMHAGPALVGDHIIGCESVTIRNTFCWSRSRQDDIVGLLGAWCFVLPSFHRLGSGQKGNAVVK